MLDQLMAHRLLMAAGGGHWQLVRKLIEEYELDPAHQNEGWTAIHWAVGDTDNVEQRTNVVEQRISEFGNSLGMQEFFLGPNRLQKLLRTRLPEESFVIHVSLCCMNNL